MQILWFIPVFITIIRYKCGALRIMIVLIIMIMTITYIRMTNPVIMIHDGRNNVIITMITMTIINSNN